MAELAARLGPLCGREAAELLRDLEADPRALDVLLRQAIASQAEGTRLAMVVDQLEELFTQCHDEDERRRFLDALVDVGSAPDGRAVVVAALRSDFFGHGAAHKALAGMLETHSILLGAMDEEDLRTTIEGPASVAGLTLEPGLADVIQRDVTGEPGGLPLLSHALVEVWSRRQGRLLTLDGYRACGGIAGAIARTANDVYDSLDPDQQRVARDIFVRLTELGEGTEDTARRATVDELARDDTVEAVRAETVLHTLAAARLVTISKGSVEVAHEALIREWPRLRGWLDEDRDGLRLMRHLTVAAHEWVQRGRDDSDLYRGARLAAAVEWSAGHGEAINPRERDFLKAGRRLQDAQVRDRGAQPPVALVARRYGRGAGPGAPGRDARHRSAQPGQLGTRPGRGRRGLGDGGPARRPVPGGAEHRPRPRPAARPGGQPALRHTRDAGRRTVRAAQQLAAPRVPPRQWRRIPVGVDLAGRRHCRRNRGGNRRPLERQRPAPGGLAGRGEQRVVAGFNPDGTLLAVLSQTSDSNSSLSLWDVATRRKIGPPLATAAAAVAYGTPFAFSPDGRVLSVVLASGEAATWDVATRAETGPRLASSDGAPYRAVAYSPDGRHLAAGSEAGGVTVYDTRTRHATGPALEAGSRASLVSSLGFDRRGTRLAAGSSTGAVYAWDLTTGKLIPLPSGPTPDVLGEGGARGAVAFSPHEDALATGFTNGVHVVDLANPDQPVPVTTQGGNVTSVAYSPDGAWITAANTDGSISIIDAAGRRKLGEPVPIGYQAGFFSPDGELFAVPLCQDGSVVLVDPRDGRETRRLSPPGMRPIPPGAWPLPAFSADGRLLAYGGVTGHVTIFDVATGAVVQTLPAPPAKTEQALFPAPETYVGRLAFSPDGTKLVAASLETGAIFDLRSGSLIARPTGWAITAMGATFTEDGALVVIAGLDQTLIFDPDTGEQVGGPIDAHQAVNGPGGTLVTADDSGTIRLVDLDSRKPVGPPMIGPQGFVITLEVVPGEAEVVATYGFAQIAQLFDFATGQPIGDPFPSQGPFGLASVGPDGKVLVAGDGTRMVHWNIDQATWPAIACEAAGRNLARAEWARYLPNAGPYRATCPDHPT
jgi:WD40 repeat protein